MNYYRAMCGADPVEEFRPLSQDATAHSRYVVLNHIRPGDVTLIDNHLKGAGRLAPELHGEDPKLPGYSSGGAAIAGNSNVIEADAIPSDGTAFIDHLMSNPFNAMLVLDPELYYLAYGQYCQDGLCAATFQMRREILSGFKILYRHASSETENSFHMPSGIRPRYFRKPIEFPAEGSTIPLRSYSEHLSLDPLAPCAGYAIPSGLPIFISVGRHGYEDASLLTAHALLEDGNPIEHCAYDASRYTNNDSRIQSDARKGLSYSMAAVIVPRAPLKPGSVYKVSMTIDSTEYNWSFKVATDAR